MIKSNKVKAIENVFIFDFNDVLCYAHINFQ